MFKKNDCLNKIMCKKLYERGFHEKDLNKIMKQRADIGRNQLLQDRTKENKDPQLHVVGLILVQ